MAKKISEMTGYEFEVFISEIFRNKGFNVEVTNYSNDGGIDIVAVNDEPIFSGKYIVQCKNWVNPVGQPEVRDLYGVVMDQRANKGILITPSSYTKQAYEFAKGKNIELISGVELNKIANIPSDDFAEAQCKVLYRDDRYFYLKQFVSNEPNNPNNYVNLINYLRENIITENKECSRELLEEIVELNNTMIDRCFKGTSRTTDKEMAMLAQAETYICMGELAKATEILVRSNAFYIRDLRSPKDYYYREISKGKGLIKGWEYKYIYAWNLYFAFKYIGYEEGCKLILSKFRKVQPSEIDPSKDNMTNALIDNLEGDKFIFTNMSMRRLNNRKTAHFSSTIFYKGNLRRSNYFFDNFYNKDKKLQISEIERVLSLTGII